MPSYLARNKSFADVNQTADGGVNTFEFLEAADTVVGIFGLLDSTALGLVVSDISGNIKKVRDRHLAVPAKSETLQDLARNEVAEGQKTATEGLLWLLRGLDFTAKALQASQVDLKLSLSEAFKKAYGETLEKYHNFFVKKGIGLALSACPSRELLYTKLKEDPNGEAPATDEELNEELTKWLNALDEIVVKINAFLYNDNDVKVKLKL